MGFRASWPVRPRANSRRGPRCVDPSIDPARARSSDARRTGGYRRSLPLPRPSHRLSNATAAGRIARSRPLRRPVGPCRSRARLGGSQAADARWPIGRLTRFLYDTAVFAHALGGQHALRDPCQAIVRAAAAGRLRGEASADLPQELAHVRLRRTGDRPASALAARHAAALCLIHELDAHDAALGLDLFEVHGRLDARDALFAAVALNRDIRAILSPDRAFDAVPSLWRVDPADPAAVDQLWT